MLTIGRFNRLTIVDQNRNDYLLDGGAKYGDIPLAKTEAANRHRIDEDIDVFIYIDHEGYLAATVETPFAQAGEVAWLRVVDVDQNGAWLDWGLKEDLFLPRKEQQSLVEVNHYCLVRILLDDRQGLIASTYLNDFLQDESDEFEQGQKVSLMIGNSTELGYKVIINHRYWGLLYANEVFQPIHKGQQLDGYIKKLREDKRLDVSLSPPGFARVTGITDQILVALANHQGFLPLSDKSSPEDIYHRFGVSKKVFKQAIGTLFKQRRIVIEDDGIRLRT